MIQLQKITKSFSSLYKPVINGLDLFILKGEFLVLIGGNGCGKSTLLKLISGEHRPDSGVIYRKEKVAQVVQDVKLGTLAELTLLENIALSEVSKPKFKFYCRFKSDILKKIKTLNAGLEKYIHQQVSSLSGGQRQMIATLMAIHSGSGILLLDEHTSALDPRMQTVLMDYTHRQIQQKQLTTIMITHNLRDALKYGDRLIMLNHGRIVFDVKGKQKQALKLNDLLELFYQHEHPEVVDDY